MATVVNATADDDAIDQSLSKSSLTINGLDGDDELISGAGADTLDGGAGNDVISSGIGNDSLIGGLGSDYLTGGLGNDVYVIDEDDFVLEEFNEGLDLVKSNADYTLTDNIEYLELIGAALLGVGNALNNRITGNAQANILSGLEGVDTLIGGAGSDIYELELKQEGLTESTIKITYADSVVETVDNGNDTIRLFGNIAGLETQEVTNVNLNLSILANTENLDASNISADSNVALILTLTGNQFANELIGNDGDNQLDGGGAIDKLVGGAGDDTYMLDILQVGGNLVLQDEVVEEDGAGNDTLALRGALTFSSNIAIGLRANTENIDASRTGSTKLNLEGNAQSNWLIGNAADNSLTGGLGDDTLNGGAGADILDGGEGDDTYIVNDLLDSVVEISSTSIDTVQTTLQTFDLSNAANINIENLVYVGASGFSGYGNDLDNVLVGGQGDDLLTGAAGGDLLNGYGGNDTLIGGEGFDLLQGGDGDDTYLIDLDDVLFEEAESGEDLVEAAFDYILDENVEHLTLLGSAVKGTGNTLDNQIIGNDASNLLDGLEGSDTLIGGLGDDVYHVSLSQIGETRASFRVVYDDTVIEAVSEGNDTIYVSGNISGLEDADEVTVRLDASLSANVENLDLSGVSAGASVILQLNLIGNNFANQLTGNDGDNTLDGGLGTIGLAANDTLIGGDGDDIYIVDIIKDGENILIQDTIIDDSGSNTLQLRGSLSFANAFNLNLANGISHINASATGRTLLNLIGNTANNQLVGNDANNVLTGGEGGDTLIGGGGSDTLIGGVGADYFVIDTTDVIDEHNDVDDSDAFNDTVEASFSINLTQLASQFSGFAAIEHITLVASALNATGNSSANIINGNAAANQLSGNENNDSLYGGNGNDTLDGGVGADDLFGGFGHDVYVVDDVADYIEESGVVETESGLLDRDMDTVLASISFNLYDALNVERLTLTGSANNNATGNDLNNLLMGNTGNNLLEGSFGVDTLMGGGGDDTYTVALIQVGEDDSTARVKLEDLITEKVNEGFDSIILEGAFGSLSTVTKLILAANIEKLDASATGQTLLTITGNTLNNYLIGNDAANILEGAAGNDTIEAGAGDTLNGGAGNDTYLLGDGFDDNVIVESSSGGSDTLIIAASYDLNLIMNVENLTLTGTESLSGTGNKFANYLVGNIADNTLTGHLGNDTLAGGLGVDILIGGLGDDVYVLQDTEDSFIELQNQGSDTIQAEISVDLNLISYANIENITLVGIDSNDATGSSVANLIKGNSAANIITGGAGVDSLQGGAGNDIYHVNLVQTSASAATATLKLEDAITEITNQGDDTIVLDNVLVLSKATTITLAANIENLDASETGASLIHLTGNTLHNQLTGNAFANSIQGGAGNDTLNGGEGADSLFGGAGNDVLNGNSQADIFVFNTALNANTNLDTIQNFETGLDKIQLDRSFMAKLKVGSLTAANFKLTSEQLESDDYIQYNAQTGALFYDADGNGAGLAIQFAVLTGSLELSVTDFVVIS